jgi:hypothetical protein
VTGGMIVRQVASGERRGLCGIPKPALCSALVPPIDGFGARFAHAERELQLLKALKGAILAAKPAESGECRIILHNYSSPASASHIDERPDR